MHGQFPRGLLVAPEPKHSKSSDLGSQPLPSQASPSRLTPMIWGLGTIGLPNWLTRVVRCVFSVLPAFLMKILMLSH